jgi:hypothetical protein
MLSNFLFRLKIENAQVKSSQMAKFCPIWSHCSPQLTQPEKDVLQGLLFVTKKNSWNNFFLIF